MTQVELGKLAQKNAESSGVNALGVRLEHDHARIGKMLETIARDRQVAVPTSPDGSHRAVIESLAAKNGAEFDAAYTRQMVSDHEKAIALFTAAAQSGDADLQELAKRALPALREDGRLAGTFEKMSSTYDVRAIAHR